MKKNVFAVWMLLAFFPTAVMAAEAVSDVKTQTAVVEKKEVVKKPKMTIKKKEKSVKVKQPQTQATKEKGSSKVS